MQETDHLKLEGGGNGEPYDGKPTYARLVPGLICDDKTAAIGSIDIQDDFAILVTNENSCKDQSESIPVSALELSSFSSRYIGYGGGVYTYLENPLENAKKEIFTEAWCRAMKPDRSGSSMEIAIEWKEQGDTADFFLMTESQPDNEVVSSTRTLDVDEVSYSGSNGKLQVYFKQKVPGTEKVAGVYTGRVNGSEKQINVECLMGGQFDSIAPRFDYPSSSQKTLAIGEAISDLLPIVNKSTVRFSLSGRLPSGLQFNAITGSITGSALASSARQNYLVSALFAFGKITRPVSIGVGPAVTVDRTSASQPCTVSSAGCDLKSAVDLANQLAPIPLVVRISQPAIDMSGTAFTVTGDLALSGTGGMPVVLDAKSLSPHFEVKNGAHLEIQRMRLINGHGVWGGSIHVENGSLLVRNSSFQNNVVVAIDSKAQGGAIYAKSSQLEVLNTEFLTNKVPWNGSLLGGGAIAIDSGLRSLIRDSVFKNNEAQMGGAIYNSGANPQLFEISNCIFSANSSMKGGAVYSQWGSVSVTDSQFLQNQATFDGGAITLQVVERAWVRDSEFDGNTGMGNRALAIYWTGRDLESSLYVLESKFHHHSTSVPQSGVLLNDMGRVVLRGSEFSQNEPIKNCVAVFDASVSDFVSLGGNHSSDGTCPP